MHVVYHESAPQAMLKEAGVVLELHSNCTKTSSLQASHPDTGKQTALGSTPSH